MPTVTTKNAARHPKAEKDTRLGGPVGRKQVDQLYNAIRKSKPKLIGPNGTARSLPGELSSFLLELTRMLDAAKSVSIVQNQATLTTIEAAAMLGVSRQFLVNLLKQEEIPYHLVGTHRRIYSRDLLRYKVSRDERRHKILRGLARAEAAEGLYDKIPPVLDED
jgi:excisionase family DNA binding protein